MNKIFISYRREDNRYPVDYINRACREKYGHENVIFDVDSIQPGENFRNYLEEQVSQCDVMIVVIGKKWVRILKERDKETLDFVRIEIESAIKRQILIIPVLVDDAKMPTENELRKSLQDLAYRQGVKVRSGRDIDRDLSILLNGVDSYLRKIVNHSKAEKLKSLDANFSSIQKVVSSSDKVVTVPSNNELLDSSNNISSSEYDLENYYQPKVFSWFGRLDRARYFVFNFIFFPSITLIFLRIRLSDLSDNFLNIFLLTLFFVLVLPVDIALTKRRLNDLGYRGWIYLFTLIPIMGQILRIYLFIEPGLNAKNEYGRAPIPLVNAKKLGFAAIIFWLISIFILFNYYEQ